MDPWCDIHSWSKHYREDARRHRGATMRNGCERASSQAGYGESAWLGEECL
jgi:hypothetical protein